MKTNPVVAVILRPRRTFSADDPEQHTYRALSSTDMKRNQLVFHLALAWLALGLCIAPGAHSQNFTIDWFTIDGGGGTSTGGVYSVSGTIGQPDAGVMSGGNYSLLGGFWGVVAAVQTPGAPLLSVIQTNGVVTVYWPRPATGFVLEQTMSIPNPPPNWSQVAFPYQTNATHISITVALPAGNRFYRLRK